MAKTILYKIDYRKLYINSSSKALYLVAEGFHEKKFIIQ